jgi:hypothetical protein
MRTEMASLTEGKNAVRNSMDDCHWKIHTVLYSVLSVFTVALADRETRHRDEDTQPWQLSKGQHHVRGIPDVNVDAQKQGIKISNHYRRAHFLLISDPHTCHRRIKIRMAVS